MERNDDRRREVRVKALNLVSVDQTTESDGPTDYTAGRTLDLSRHGMRLEFSHALPVGTQVRLSLALQERILELTGTIRFVKGIDADTYAMGIEFTELSAEHSEALAEYLQHHDNE